MNESAPKRSAIILLFSVVSLMIGGAVGYFGARPRGAAPITISTLVPTATSSPTATPSPIRVYVSGAVQAPGVYELEQGCIVADAIQVAGGAAAEADLECINLAQELRDQQQVHVPEVGEATPPPVVSGGSGASTESAGLVNINTAPVDELETLPGVGPSTAEKIVAFREANGPFERVEDIQNVPGIGPVTFEEMREMITAE
ncbi:MAG: helix-hairpin-helix domain-containing protein [Anaerolineae bacterium]|nr:helix-hairpin-helix domain-containing protein [Anaerolineae bacterium]